MVINADVSAKIQVKMCAKIVMFGIMPHVVVKMVDMKKSVIHDSVIACDEIIEATKSILTKTFQAKSAPTNLNKEKVIYNMILLIVVFSIYFSLKY